MKPEILTRREQSETVKGARMYRANIKTPVVVVKDVSNVARQPDSPLGEGCPDCR